MSYVTQTSRPSPGSLAAVIGVHAAIGLALVAGLTVSGVIKADEKTLPVIEFRTPVPPPPPEPTPTPRTSETQPQTSQPRHVPPTAVELATTPLSGPTTNLILPPAPLPQPGPVADPLPPPAPLPSATATGFAPVGAKPRNDPARWLRDDDYRSSWINRELTGTARFRLDISRSGTITGCRVTGSTGHDELDRATCSLLRNRARFEPARGREGEPVAGTYDGAVRWVLPE